MVFLRTNFINQLLSINEELTNLQNKTNLHA